MRTEHLTYDEADALRQALDALLQALVRSHALLEALDASLQALIRSHEPLTVAQEARCDELRAHLWELRKAEVP